MGFIAARLRRSRPPVRRDGLRGGLQGGCRARGATIAAVGKVAPEAARKAAQAILGEVALGGDPVVERRQAEAATGTTLRAVVENFLVRGAFDREKWPLRTVGIQRGIFERLVFPTLGARQVGEIKRSEITRLIESIEDEHGPRMASLTLAYLGRVLNWHASREDDFRSPIVRGMTNVGVTRRDRVLSDDELRAFWQATTALDHPYARFVRFVLLTATRRNEAAHMRWDEVEGTTWTIPGERYKTKVDTALPLSRAAQALLAGLPRVSDYVFATGTTALRSLAHAKRLLDARMLAELRRAATDPAVMTLERWTTHDLRRSARSLMTRAGVSPDHAERCLGHAIPGIRGTYDRHGFHDEKLAAFEALAAQIARIVDPQPNILPMRGPR
jgi:integrase